MSTPAQVAKGVIVPVLDGGAAGTAAEPLIVKIAELQQKVSNFTQQIADLERDRNKLPLNFPLATRTPLIIRTPTQVYSPSGKILIDITPLDIPPSIPDDRLPKEADKQTPTKTPMGKSVTIGQALRNQSFGNLLFNPVTDEPLTIINNQGVNRSEDYRAAIRKKAISDFASWIAKEQFGEEPTEKFNAYNIAALIYPSSLAGFTGNIGYAIGLEHLSLQATDYHLKRANAYYPIRTTIPVNYKIEAYESTTTPTFTFPEKIIYSATALSKINLIYSILGGEKWFESDDEKDTFTQGITQHIETIIRHRGNSIHTTEKEEEKENKIIIEDIPDLLKWATALLYFRSGFQDYPVIVPKDLTQITTPNDPSKEEEKIAINHLTYFQSWQTKQLDSWLGQYPIEILIKDSDLIKVGAQEKKVSLPNIAESLAELVGLGITNQSLLNAILNSSLKNLIETGSTRQQSIITHHLLMAIQEYIGFTTRQKVEEVQFGFNPFVGSPVSPEESISRALTPTKVKIKVEENDDKESLEKQLSLIAHSVAIIKAAHWRKVTDNNFREWKDMFKSAAKALEEEEKDFEDFLEKVEEGFTSVSGIKDANNPYGRDRSQRPRTKDISEDKK